MSVEDGYGTGVFAVRPRFGRAPVPEILADAMRAALEGTLPLAERLRQREADYRQDAVRSAPPRISWHNGEVSGAATGIVEVRAGDRTGLLYRLTAAITGEGLDVTSARIETLGADAVDSFYVCNPSGSPVDPDQRRRVDDALAAATRGTPAPVALDTPG
jgi:[protein-PII] uridylyltransferase